MAEPRFRFAAFPIVVAHRGDPFRHPENTLPGFLSAIAAGAEAVEFDVRLTADGVPVLMHDPDVSRTTGAAGLVRSMRLKELRELRIRGRASSDLCVPLLSEALEAVGDAGGGVDIEIKNVPGEPDFDAGAETVLEATLDALEATGFGGPVVLSSFNPATVRRARELAPEVPTGLLIIDAISPVDAVEVAATEGHAFVLPSVGALLTAGQEVVAEAHASEVRVGTWNADDPATVRTLLDWGVDAVATNDPAMASTARARWRAREA